MYAFQSVRSTALPRKISAQFQRWDFRSASARLPGTIESSVSIASAESLRRARFLFLSVVTLVIETKSFSRVCDSDSLIQLRPTNFPTVLESVDPFRSQPCHVPPQD